VNINDKVEIHLVNINENEGSNTFLIFHNKKKRLNLMTKHNIDKRQFSLAVPHFLNLSIRKMFVHMTEEYQVQLIEDLGKFDQLVINI